MSGELGPLPARWYVVSSEGLATLCAGQEDAESVAGDCDKLYPRHAPHRALVLGDVAAAVAAERERCAKLCESMKTTPLDEDPEEVERGYNAALKRAAANILGLHFYLFEPCNVNKTTQAQLPPPGV